MFRFSDLNPYTLFIFITVGLLGCSTPAPVATNTHAGYYLQDTITENTADIEAIISPYKKDLAATMSEVINTSDMVMERGTPESLLGNFTSDLCMHIANSKNIEADFCVLNTGGLRVPIPKGNITRGRIFELMPFENELVVLTLSGSTINKLFEYIGSRDGIPTSKELRLLYSNKRLEVAKINGTPFDSTQTYRVITSDYLARGGDNMTFFDEAIEWTTMNIKLRDAILEYIVTEKEQGRSIQAQLDGRIKHETK